MMTKTCTACDGGKETCPRCGGIGEFSDGDTCNYCHGDGWIPCNACGGTGEIELTDDEAIRYMLRWY